MRVELTNTDGTAARYLYEDDAGTECVNHAPYPPVAGDLMPRFVAWAKAGGEPEPFERPVAVPDEVDDWQFAGQAAAEGIISRAEALEWSGAGVVPKPLADAVDRLITDEDQHFKVMIFLRGSKAYPRRHRLVPLLGPLLGKADDAALDAFWISAGQR